MKKRITINFFLLMLLLPSLLVAAVPQTINYQGHLASSGGSPVNAAVEMSFTIYNAATNGTNLWTEDQTVQVNDGIYAVALGAINPIDPAIIDGALWLGVKVGVDAEMTPRQKLNSVPFAMKANSLVSPVSGKIYYLTAGSSYSLTCTDINDALVGGGAECSNEYALKYSRPDSATNSWQASCFRALSPHYTYATKIWAICMQP